MTSENYIKEADAAYDEALEIVQSTDGWKLEKEDLTNEVTVEMKKNAKGKKKQVSKKPEGFEGEMIGDKRTGKCQQFYGDSLFDGYMLDDELVQGRFYFSNGDFFMGTFKDNEMDKGTYIRFEDKLKVTGASF